MSLLPKENLENLENLDTFVLTSLKDDKDTQQVRTIQSLSPLEHVLKDYNDVYANSYLNSATDSPYFNFDNGYGINPKNIDEELRVGKLSVHNGDTNQLFTRPFLTIPYIGKGHHFVDNESDLLNQETTLQRRQCNSLAGVFLKNQFTPLVQHLKDNVQNPMHIIPENSRTDWVRGGIDTTQIRKDIDYFSRCNNDKNISDVLVQKKGYLSKN
jgi:hypothetical protein